MVKYSTVLRAGSQCHAGIKKRAVTAYKYNQGPYDVGVAYTTV